MARPHVLSNGSLHIGINRYGEVHDVYYPFVGLENHSMGRQLRHRVGLWVDGRISWLDDGTWEFEFSVADTALLGHTRARNDSLNLLLVFDDVVDAEIDALYRNIHVVNLSDTGRDVRLFMHQAFTIGDGKSNTDTVQYLPDSDAILHYRGPRAFIIGGRQTNGAPFDQHSVGLFGIEGKEGTWRDAEDGDLEGNAVEHGMVDSTIRFRLSIAAHSSDRILYWLAAGTNTRGALTVHKTVWEHGVHARVRATIEWWHRWLQPAERILERIPVEFRKNYLRSLMIIKAHINRNGSVIASSDAAMLNYSRDAYTYCWPRDAAYALWPLLRLGYTEEVEAMFDFMRDGLHPNGYLSHKYRADGALGSSWHPYQHGDTVAPPIQEDETAAILFIFTQYYHAHAGVRLLEKYYEGFVKPMADFLAGYVDDTTGLPKPTYDLWEERFMVSTYTVSLVIAALGAAADLADEAGAPDDAVKWRTAADDLRVAARARLYDRRRGYVINGLTPTDDGYKDDTTLNMASFYGAFMYGLFDAHSDELTSSLKHLTERFTVTAGRPAVPRYEHDAYHRKPGLPPNWWIITTLWLAQHAIEVGNKAGAIDILRWVNRHASASGTFPEQLSPEDGTPVSVDPLVWSHAEFVSTVLDLVEGDQ